MQQPFVSIIIPNLNNQERLALCLAALMKQSYPPDRLEIIVVDNGSMDDSPVIARQYPVQFMQETAYTSPYWCRNAGIKVARGNIIALLDSNCAPVPSWLEAGVNCLQTTDAAIVTGPVRFNFSPAPTLAERIDYLYSVFTPEDVASGSALPATHLFIKKEVFDIIGLFIANIRSLGDIEWTQRAHKRGYRFGYAKYAIVDYPAKVFRKAVKKMVRLGGGEKELWANRGKSFYEPKWIWRILKNFLPPSPDFYREMARRNREEQTQIPSIPLFLGLYLIKLCYAWGMLFKKLPKPVQDLEND